MTLSLSSEALPSISVEDLRRGARRRGLEGLELVVGTGAGPHGGIGSESGPSAVPIRDEAPPIQWLLLGAGSSVTELLYWSRQAHLIGAGLVLRDAVVESPLCVPLVLLHRTDPERAQRAAAWARRHDAQTGWEIRLDAADERRLEAVMDVTMPTLGHVRLKGAGPNVASEGTGAVETGTVLKELALRGYDGTVALAPSGSGEEDDWRAWLFEERGWGCNTAAKKAAAR